MVISSLEWNWKTNSRFSCAWFLDIPIWITKSSRHLGIQFWILSFLRSTRWAEPGGNKAYIEERTGWCTDRNRARTKIYKRLGLHCMCSKSRQRFGAMCSQIVDAYFKKAFDFDHVISGSSWYFPRCLIKTTHVLGGFRHHRRPCPSRWRRGSSYVWFIPLDEMVTLNYFCALEHGFWHEVPRCSGHHTLSFYTNVILDEPDLKDALDFDYGRSLGFVTWFLETQTALVIARIGMNDVEGWRCITAMRVLGSSERVVWIVDISNE